MLELPKGAGWGKKVGGGARWGGHVSRTLYRTREGILRKQWPQQALPGRPPRAKDCLNCPMLY